MADRGGRERDTPQQRSYGVMQGDESSGDARGARAPVRLDHVAVELHGALAEAAEVGHGAQGTADQALDFLRASGLFSPRRFAVGAGMSRAGQHAVLGGHPALATPLEKPRNAVLDARSADHARVAAGDQPRTLGMPRVMAASGRAAGIALSGF